jgi:hypothetical protein
MNNKSIKKIIVFSIILLLIVISLAPIFNSASIENSYYKLKTIDNLKTISSDREWTWKEPYPNYSPSGLPDFDQKQKQWKSIVDGGNGIVESNATGDDIQFFIEGSVVDPEELIIAPGENCQLDTTAGGDDIEKWAFSGPAALANCFWWFDSKFADPKGIPGDGDDEFPLVKKYVTDDHSPENVPLLIEELARYINTSGKGMTTVEDMGNAIDLWLSDNALDDRLEKTIKNEPTFEFIYEEVNKGQNVILLIGFYDYEVGVKRKDQFQPEIIYNKFLQTSTWWDYQSFVPTVDRLDSISIPLHSTSSETCEVEINVYDTEDGDPIGTASLDPGLLSEPTWIQFNFDPYIELTPFQLYFFDVRQVESGYFYEWYYASPDPYGQGVGWMNQIPEDLYGLPFDWSFETEYYDPPPGSIRKDARYVTCAGINFENEMIAFSDPFLDVNNSNDINHNDAKNVSHDVYFVNQTCPCPDLNYSIWLPIFPNFFNYTLVENVVVVCPIPDDDPPVVEITKPVRSIYLLNDEIYPFLLPLIIGFIEIEVDAFDNRGVDNVKFLINDEVKATDPSRPYMWKWEEGEFFIQTIKIDAVDLSGNHGYDTLTVLKFF